MVFEPKILMLERENTRHAYAVTVIELKIISSHKCPTEIIQSFRNAKIGVTCDNYCVLMGYNI